MGPSLKLLVGFFLLAFFTISGIGYAAWKYKFESKFTELKEKDSVRYFKMLEEAKVLNFQKAKKLFFALESMTPSQVTMLNYNKFNLKWRKDSSFRQKVLKEQKIIRKLQRKAMSNVYKGELELINSFEKFGTRLSRKWEKMGPWEKGLVLREKCSDYLNKENLKNKERIESLKLTRFDELQENLVRKQNPSELCEKWIPLGQKEKFVEKGLQNLKMKLSYLGYISILKELGIPEDEVINFSTQLKKLVGDFTDS